MKGKSILSSFSTKGLKPDELGLRHLAPAMLLEMVLRTTVSMVNVAFLSRISDNMVSAVSISTQYISILQMIATAVATGSIVCINQAIGMRNQERVERLANVAIAANTLMGLVFGMLFLCFSRPFLSIMKVGEDCLYMASVYMRIVGGSMVIQCLQLVVSSVCRSMGRTKVPLCVNLCINGVNLIGCALVVFQPIPLGVEPVTGVAAANVISQVVGLGLALQFMYRRAKIRIRPSLLRPFPWKDLKLSLEIGIPGGINNIAYGSGQLVTTAIIALTGEPMVAAKVYITNVVHYICLIGQACGQANTILIGYRIGAGRYDEAMALRKRVTRIALISNITCSLLVILARKALIGIFTTDSFILEIASTVIVIDLFVETGRALNNTLSGALQATGDVVYQLVVNQASNWIVSVGLSYIFGIVLGFGLNGVWVAFALDEATRGLILLRRWNGKKWMEKAEKRRTQVAGQVQQPRKAIGER